MVHIRIINGRQYSYTTRWNKTTCKVENVYLGAVDPQRIGSRSRNKRKSANEVLRDAKLAERSRVNAALRDATVTTS